MKKMYALLVQMGMNMWDEYHQELLFDEAVWNHIVEKCVECGLTHIVLDVGEGILLKSHPELAVKGSWEPEKLSAEVNRLKELGITLIPKLNFSVSRLRLRNR